MATDEITIDITTLTLGEAAAAEVASGLTIQQLAKGRATLKLLALFVHELRHSERPRSWSDLSNLRLLDGSSSTSPSPGAGTPTSSDG